MTKAEQIVKEALELEGFRVSKVGMPDFFAWKYNEDGSLKELVFVEVKTGTDRVTAAQGMCLCLLECDVNIKAAVGRVLPNGKVVYRNCTEDEPVTTMHDYANYILTQKCLGARHMSEQPDCCKGTEGDNHG